MKMFQLPETYQDLSFQEKNMVSDLTFSIEHN